MLGVAVGPFCPRILLFLEEGGEVENVLPCGILCEFHAVAILGLEVLAVGLVDVLAVEGTGYGRIIGQGDHAVTVVEAAAGVKEAFEPDFVAVTFGVLRQGVIAQHRGKIGVEIGEGRPDRLVLGVLQNIVGRARPQVDARLLLHDRQVVGQDFHFDPGQIIKVLQLFADRKGRRGVFRQEDQLGAGELLPLGIVRRLCLHARAHDRRVQADGQRSRTEHGRAVAAEFEEPAAADLRIDRLLGLVEHFSLPC